MKTVSFKFNLQKQLFGKQDYETDLTYLKWPLNWESKIWARGFTDSCIVLIIKIGQVYGNNVTADGQLNDIPMTSLGQDSNKRLTRGLEKLQQNGVISDLVFDSKLVSKKASIVRVYPPLAKELNTNTRDTTKVDHDEVLEVLNKLIDGKYSKSTELLARLKDYSKQECIDVVRHRVNVWQDDPKMSKFIRPSTIFGKSKFEETYLPQAKAAFAEDQKMREMFGEPV